MNNSKILATIGYEGLKPEDFLDKLKENNISVLVDVRQNPISRKQGFSKSKLEIFLQNNGIRYVHFQKLGTPRELRSRLKEEGDYEVFFEEYKGYLMNQKGWLDYLKNMVEETTCCLMCFERNHQECHRQVISSALEEMSDIKLGVVHI